MRIASLERLVALDVEQQYWAWRRGELNGVFDGETWAEYVANLLYWETRDGLTGEHIADRVLPYTPDNGGIRLVDALAKVWFDQAFKWFPPVLHGYDCWCETCLAAQDLPATMEPRRVRVEVLMPSVFVVNLDTDTIESVVTETPSRELCTLGELVAAANPPRVWVTSLDQRFDVDDSDLDHALEILEGAQWPDSQWLA